MRANSVARISRNTKALCSWAFSGVHLPRRILKVDIRRGGDMARILKRNTRLKTPQTIRLPCIGPLKPLCKVSRGFPSRSPNGGPVLHFCGVLGWMPGTRDYLVEWSQNSPVDNTRWGSDDAGSWKHSSQPASQATNISCFTRGPPLSAASVSLLSNSDFYRP